ncbi:GGDEF domain-containing protein [Clostridium estertheticum]|uniref:GGDEF domain-containing protein n=1 Tax=Clostridium estertheticum TaxID=238834 RepID=A0A5N7IZN1_9CLOT|nr:GGDEF domain-containing protein [Clostridium estertheticum]MPQ31272.1 GGDEF domain-containing protein [Clostridium estertheticum]MPQ61946.1 GGDEF domain-containing protein [Clostridium estertheticum]
MANYIIISPNTTLEVAKTMCSRVCMNIDELKEEDNANYKMGLSCGLCEYKFNSKISASELKKDGKGNIKRS